MSAFSIKNILQFETAYLGVYPNGLGVTDRGEGDGSNHRDRVDNIGDRHDIVLIEFSTKVVPDRILLDDVGADSDILIVMGTANDPYNHHLTLTGAMLTAADIDDGNNAPRWADINPAQRSGNWMLIMPRLLQSNDEFKIRKLEFKCPRATNAAGLSSRAGYGSFLFHNVNILQPTEVADWQFLECTKSRPRRPRASQHCSLILL